MVIQPTPTMAPKLIMNSCSRVRPRTVRSAESGVDMARGVLMNDRMASLLVSPHPALVTALLSSDHRQDQSRPVRGRVVHRISCRHAVLLHGIGAAAVHV